MKVAVVGKGGSGKTTLAGTLARVLAQRRHRVLAIDGDPNPNLALTLGITREDAERIRSIPASLVEAVGGGGPAPATLRLTMERERVLGEYAADAPDGVKLIVMGKPADGSAGSGCMCASHRAVRGLITEMTAAGDHTITDMEAGLEHLKRGTARNVEAMLIVAEPYYRSLEAASRTFSLASELKIPHVYAVANKVRSDADREAIDAYCRQHAIPVAGVVPYEERFVAAEQAARAPFDFAEGSAGLRAIEAVADRLIELEARTAP
ncbi:MAG: AAA family ATPase [Pseudomonadota bacterium]|jgi:CO dehydrogenase maturation factor